MNLPQGPLVMKEIQTRMRNDMNGDTWCIGDVYDNRRMKGYCRKINRNQFRKTFLKKNFDNFHITCILAHDRYEFKNSGVDFTYPESKASGVANAIASKVHGKRLCPSYCNMTQEQYEAIEVPQWLVDDLANNGGVK